MLLDVLLSNICLFLKLKSAKAIRWLVKPCKKNSLPHPIKVTRVKLKRCNRKKQKPAKSFNNRKACWLLILQGTVRPLALIELSAPGCGR